MKNFKKLKKKKIKLKGFNNLQKILSINLFDYTIATSEFEKEEYVKYINQRYSAENIEKITKEIVYSINAKILDVSNQNFEPYGASSLTLLSENHTMHLDKSHISVHTYPEFENKDGILSYRVDIDISTCGDIIPLKALNILFDYFETDIVVIDFLQRGYITTIDNKKIYNDYNLKKISQYIKTNIKENYKIKDYKNKKKKFWQTKMLIKTPKIKDFFHPEKIIIKQDKKIFKKLKKEIKKIFKKL